MPTHPVTGEPVWFDRACATCCWFRKATKARPDTCQQAPVTRYPPDEIATSYPACELHQHPTP